ncbi:hypothetical protein D3C76_644830 [compost metagenome]
MAKRDRAKSYARKEAVKDETEAKGTDKIFLSFNLKHLDQTQPKNSPQTIAVWHDNDLLQSLVHRIMQVSQLTRLEAVQQQQLKIYGDFPPKDKTDFSHPAFVPENVYWGVLKHVGGQTGTVAGYIEDDVFNVVFFDKDHRFWITPKKHT